MPTYKIGNKKIVTDKPLTDAEIDEIAASEGLVTPKVTEKTSIGSDGQLIPSIDVNGVADAPEPSQVTEPVTAPTGDNTISSGFVRGLKDPIDAGAQLLPRGLSFVASGGGLIPNMFSKWLDSEARRVDEMVNKDEEDYQTNRAASGEEGFDWARLGGNIFNPATLAAGYGAGSLARGVIAGGVLGGAATGALTPVTNVPEDSSFTEEKLKQTGGGAVAGGVGGAVINGLGRVFSPVVPAAEQKLLDMGVKLTPGMLLGDRARTFEDLARNLPVVGSSVEKAQLRALESFNKGVANKALAKVGEKLPENVKGREAVQYVNSVVNTKYDDVLSKTTFTLDFAAHRDINQAINGLASPAQRKEASDILKKHVYDKLTNYRRIPGETYKEMESDLMKEATKYLNSPMATERNVGEALLEAVQGMKASLGRQNPAASSELRRINSAYGEIEVLRTAAANNGAEGGIFTPKQYQTAVRQRDVTRNKRKFAAGQARGQDVGDAGVDIMGNVGATSADGKIAVGATGLYTAVNHPLVAGVAAIASPVLYSETGIRAMTMLMTQRPEIAKKIGEKLIANAKGAGSITGVQVLKAYNEEMKAER